MSNDRDVRLTVIASLEARLRNSPDMISDFEALLAGTSWGEDEIVIAVTTMAALYDGLARAGVDQAWNVLAEGRRAVLALPDH